MKCEGRNLDEHCCWVSGKVCWYLEENSEPGYRWSCGLRRELGSWDAVLADARYEPIAKAFAHTSYNCKTWPDRKCTLCGAGG